MSDQGAGGEAAWAGGSVVPFGNIAVGFFILFMAYLQSRGFQVFDGRDVIIFAVGLLTVLVGFGASFHERIWALNRWWFIAAVLANYAACKAGW